MFRLRIILSALLAVAIVLAPMMAAWTSAVKAMGPSIAVGHADANDLRDDGTAAPLIEDCASLIKGASATDGYPCSAKDKLCPPASCMTCCFQFVGINQQCQTLGRLVASHTWPMTSTHPTDWSTRPPLPPPQA